MAASIFLFSILVIYAMPHKRKAQMLRHTSGLHLIQEPDELP